MRTPLNSGMTREVTICALDGRLFCPLYGEVKVVCPWVMKFACPESHKRSLQLVESSCPIKTPAASKSKHTAPRKLFDLRGGIHSAFGDNSNAAYPRAALCCCRK